MDLNQIYRHDGRRWSVVRPSTLRLYVRARASFISTRRGRGADVRKCQWIDARPVRRRSINNQLDYRSCRRKTAPPNVLYRADQKKLFAFCYDSKSFSHKFPPNLAYSFNDGSLTTRSKKIIHFTWHVYAYYLVMFRETKLWEE